MGGGGGTTCHGERIFLLLRAARPTRRVPLPFRFLSFRMRWCGRGPVVVDVLVWFGVVTSMSSSSWWWGWW